MRRASALIVAVFALSGCNIAIPNGIFSCGTDSDCPSGLYCWSTSRCNDTPEPGCTPRTCADVIEDFAQAGITVECGSFDDGCDGMTEECGTCPPGTECGGGGANSVTCGCDENTCNAYVESGAECGLIPSACGGDPIRCGDDDCPGLEVCISNRCVCPAGVDCDAPCGGCKANEYCDPDSRNCICDPIDACTLFECTDGVIPDGCGGFTRCDCPEGLECENFSGAPTCVEPCDCDLNGIECGFFNCGLRSQFCGTCSDNGFPDGYSCQPNNNRCSCSDVYEQNDSVSNASLICGLGGAQDCSTPNWNVSVQATLDGESGTDVDYYVLQVADEYTPIDISLNLNALNEDVLVYAAYTCANGEQGLAGCSDDLDDDDGLPGVPSGTTVCVSADGEMTLFRSCDFSFGFEEPATLYVGVVSLDRPECLAYELFIAASGMVVPPF